MTKFAKPLCAALILTTAPCALLAQTSLRMVLPVSGSGDALADLAEEYNAAQSDTKVAGFRKQRLERVRFGVRDIGERAEALKTDDFKRGAKLAPVDFTDEVGHRMGARVKFVGERVDRGAECKGHVRPPS